MTIAGLRYQSHGRDREGVCSTYAAKRVGTTYTAGQVLGLNLFATQPNGGVFDNLEHRLNFVHGVLLIAGA